MTSQKILRIVPIALFGVTLCAVVVLAGCQGAEPAGPSSAALAIGASAPDFTLNDNDGTAHTLSAYRGKVVALVFTSQECPYSRGADPQLAELAKKYAERGVTVLSIDSHKDTTLEQIKQYRTEEQLPYPILKDAENKYADAVGAKQTPEVFLLDAEGKLAYHGAFDNRRGPDGPGDTPLLANAIEALLAGKAPDPAETRQWGCTIKRAE